MAPQPATEILTNASYYPSPTGELAKRFPSLPSVFRCIGQLAGWDCNSMVREYNLLTIFAAAGILSSGLPDTEQNFVDSVIAHLRVQDSGTLKVLADQMSIAWNDIGYNL